MAISSLKLASVDDRDEIVALIYAVVERLNQSGIPQWDAVYPNESDVDGDIEKGQLYVARDGDRIAAIVTLNKDSDPAYQSGDWMYTGPDFRIVHRLCVSPDMQGRGIGRRMMEMAEEMLTECSVKSIRLDAFSQNPYSLKLYEKLGYRITGEAVWRKGLFYLMEKNLAPQLRETDKERL